MRISNPPDSSALMATARSFGNYNLSAALADLIDNSIKAKASEVDINFLPVDGDVIVTIRDDGCGMTGDELKKAMKPASSHPEEERSQDDLGRFGWGMKSASLSQSRVMKVVSWTREGIVAAGWDIDDITDWGMDYYENDEALDILDISPTTDSGTEVRWERTDRLLQNSGHEPFENALTHLISTSIESLALVFHRYLLGDSSKKLTIKINGTALPTIDPFLKTHPATQCMDKESIVMANSEKISLQPFVLPHFSKLTQQEQRLLGGAEGMIKNQGFYVYRNKRLIIHGTWFKLIPHRDISQLTRIQVDLPNSVDHDWRITLDKSGAQLPNELKTHLRHIVKKFNRRSHSVHRKKGVVVRTLDRSPVWNRIVRNGQIKYTINREHPLLVSLINHTRDEAEEFDIESVLTLLESYFPTDTFISDASKGELNQTITNEEDFESLVMHALVSYVQSHSAPHKLKNFLEYLRPVEPFASHWIFVEEYVRNNATNILE
ncbi:ATP-binding protein [Alteromonas facilis]|uniref:ATP-binding protein n=1 Tax=Alteromonas facilis TaxID=2048004 RepID=UPI000C2903AE|nr:ATP-binding protein [Alteromonas facilis]